MVHGQYIPRDSMMASTTTSEWVYQSRPRPRFTYTSQSTLNSNLELVDGYMSKSFSSNIDETQQQAIRQTETNIRCSYPTSANRTERAKLVRRRPRKSTSKAREETVIAESQLKEVQLEGTVEPVQVAYDAGAALNKRGKEKWKDKSKQAQSRVRAVSLQIFPSSVNVGRGGRSVTMSLNLSTLNLLSTRGLEKKGGKVVGFSYEMFAPCEAPKNMQPRKPNESWLDLETSPVASTISCAAVANSTINTEVASMPPACPLPPLPATTQQSSTALEDPQSLKSLIQTHLTTLLLSLEIDIAQMDTKLFTVFDQLRMVHTSFLLYTSETTMLHPPVLTAPPSCSQAAASGRQLQNISVSEAKSRVQSLQAGLVALGTQIRGYVETVDVVEKQLCEALAKMDVGDSIEELRQIMEEEISMAMELRSQVDRVKSELARLERKRIGLGGWAEEVYTGWRLIESKATDYKYSNNPSGSDVCLYVPEQKTAASSLAVPGAGKFLSVPTENFYLERTVPPATASVTDLHRTRSIRTARSTGNIRDHTKRIYMPINVNKPLPASPGDADFELESEFIRTRDRLPPPVSIPVPDSKRPPIELVITPNLPPVVPPRNPRRTAYKVETPPEMTTPFIQPPSVTDDTTFTLDLSPLDNLVSRVGYHTSRSAVDVYNDFFSIHSQSDDGHLDDDQSYYSRGTYEEADVEENETRNAYELPPQLPSIGPDEIYANSRFSNCWSEGRRKSLDSLSSSIESHGTPTTPVSPVTPITPISPSMDIPSCSTTPSPTITISSTQIHSPFPQKTPYTFFSPSSFPPPPSFDEFSRKVQMEGMLQYTTSTQNGTDCLGGERASYAPMDIDPFQCTLQRKTYYSPVSKFEPTRIPQSEKGRKWGDKAKVVREAIWSKKKEERQPERVRAGVKIYTV